MLFLIQKKLWTEMSVWQPWMFVAWCVLAGVVLCATPVDAQTTPPVAVRGLDPSRGVGTVECVDRGVHRHCCDKVDKLAPMCVQVQRHGEWRCTWTELPDFVVNVSVSATTPDLIRLFCKPEFDIPLGITLMVDLTCLFLMFVCSIVLYEPSSYRDDWRHRS